MSLSGRYPNYLLYLLATSILSCGLYLIFDKFLNVTGQEIVKAWYYGEIVNLQEGQILPAIAKNQNFLEKSPFLTSVVLIDASKPHKNLFSVGQITKPISKAYLEESQHSEQTITSYRTGFLSYSVFVKLPGKHGLFLIYDVWSGFLIFSYWISVALSTLLVVYLIMITIKVTNFERKKREELRTDLLNRLSHDVNSPLLALSAISLKVKKLDFEVHNSLEQATASIRRLFAQTDKMDKQILSGSENSKSAIDAEIHAIPMLAVIKELFLLKQGEYTFEKNLEMTISSEKYAEDIFSMINLDEFRRHFSNLIKNSVEATRELLKRKIEVLISFNQELKIEIKDNGRGVPPEILKQFGKKGFSFGKENGKGLGVHFTLESVKQWNGRIKIESDQNLGTTVSLILPRCETPKWYKSNFGSELTKKIIVVDDDQSIFDRWKSRFPISDRDLCFFSTTDAFQKWYLSDGQIEDELLFAFDYHLEENCTGLDLIREHELSKESILVTTAYLDEKIQSECQKMNIKIYPKILI